MKNSKNTAYEPVGDLVSIFKRGRTWYVIFQLNGKQQRKSLKTTNKQEARQQALLLEAELLQGKYQPREQPPDIVTVIENYLKFIRTEGRSVKTLVKYESVLKQVQELATELGRSGIEQIDLTFVDECRHRRAAAGRAAKTIYTETVIVKQLVNFAVTRSQLRSNPLAGLKIKRPKSTPQPCWTPEEVERILAASHPLILLVVHTRSLTHHAKRLAG